MNIVNWGKDGIEDTKESSNIVIKIDDSLVSTHKIDMPNINIFQAKKAIPFALEDKLLDDIENIDFFIKKNGSSYNVLVISKEVIRQIKETIKEKKLSVIGAYPNFMFLPFSDSGIYYTKNEGKITFRADKFIGSTIPENIFKQKFKDNDLDLILTDEQSNDYNLINFIELNLKELFKENIKPWFWPIILLILAFVLNFINVSMENKTLQTKVDTLKISNEESFKKIFPKSSKIVDIQVQVEQKLKQYERQEILLKNDFISALLKKKGLNDRTQIIKFDKTLEVK